MYLKGDKRKISTIILKKLKGSDTYENLKSENEYGNSMDEEYSKDAKQTAANKLINSIGNRDAEGVISAITDLFNILDAQEDSMEDEEM